MKWMLVAIMAIVYNGDERDIYIWQQPAFDSASQCREWVQENNYDIWLHLRKEFPGDTVDRLLCMDETRLRQFIETTQGEREI